MSSTVSAFTTRKLPSFKPTAKAFPSGEKAQHLPPIKGSEEITVECSAVEQSRRRREKCGRVYNSLCVAGPLALPRWGFRFHHWELVGQFCGQKHFLHKPDNLRLNLRTHGRRRGPTPKSCLSSSCMYDVCVHKTNIFKSVKIIII